MLIFVILAVTSLLSACSESHDDDLGPQQLNETRARAEVADYLKVTVPAGYGFKGAYAMPPGPVGTPDYYMRFDRPTPGLEDMANELAVANRKFRPFQDVDCTVPWLAGNTRLSKLGIPCSPVTRMQITNDSDPEIEIDYLTGTTLVLASDPKHTSLYVIAIGS